MSLKSLIIVVVFFITTATSQYSNETAPDLSTIGPVPSVPLPHHVHDKIRGLISFPAAEHPTLPVTFSLDSQAYSSLGLRLPRLLHNSPDRLSVPVMAVADTGAQMLLIPTAILDYMNIDLDTLLFGDMRLTGAGNSPIIVDGGVLMKVTATNQITKETKISRQLCFASRQVTSILLSQSCCRDLGLIPENFPEVGTFDYQTKITRNLMDLAVDERWRYIQAKGTGDHEEMKRILEGCGFGCEERDLNLT